MAQNVEYICQIKHQSSPISIFILLHIEVRWLKGLLIEKRYVGGNAHQGD